MNWLLYYVAIINIIGILVMSWDKKKARNGAWRIPEDNLMVIALLGGSAGIYLGLKIFRHKTRHFKFSVGIPLIFVLQAALIVWLLQRGLGSVWKF